MWDVDIESHREGRDDSLIAAAALYISAEERQPVTSQSSGGTSHASNAGSVTRDTMLCDRACHRGKHRWVLARSSALALTYHIQTYTLNNISDFKNLRRTLEGDVSGKLACT